MQGRIPISVGIFLGPGLLLCHVDQFVLPVTLAAKCQSPARGKRLQVTHPPGSVQQERAVVGDQHDEKQRWPLLPCSECGPQPKPAAGLQRSSMERQPERCDRLVLSSSRPGAITVTIRPRCRLPGFVAGCVKLPAEVPLARPQVPILTGTGCSCQPRAALVPPSNGASLSGREKPDQSTRTVTLAAALRTGAEQLPWGRHGSDRCDGR